MYPCIKVYVADKGSPLSKKLYDENPEIHKLYPSHDTFNEIYRSLVGEAIERKTSHLLEISENSIKIDGVIQTSKQIKNRLG